MRTGQQKMSVTRLLEEATKKYANKEVVYDLKERITYKELQKKVDRLAKGLENIGVEKGDKIGVCLPNWNETVVIFFAAAKLGAVLVPFNPMYRSHEIEYIIKNSEMKVLFISKTFEHNINLSIVTPLVEYILSVRFNNPSLISYNELLVQRGQVVEPPIDVDRDLFCILYTSGTTGFPKGVMTSHNSVVQCAEKVSKQMRCNEDDVFIIPAPLFHIFGITCNLMTAIISGAKMVLQEKYDPQKVLQLIEEENVTVHQGVPTMFLKELEQEDFTSYDLSSLRTGMVGAAPISPDKVKKIREKMGIHLCQSYGITETGSVTLTGYDDDEKTILETVGKPIEGVEVRIVDKDRQPLKVGKVGEIAVNSFATMVGYYNLPDKTAKVLDKDGWFYTGDLGQLDEEGNLHFVGREKEMIIRGGFNIYPQEIEAILSTHSKIVEAAVIGIPDKVLGEIVCAVIKVKGDQTCTVEEIKDYVAERMARYKVPSQIVFTDQLPVTSSGKIQKMELRNHVIGEFGVDANTRV